MHIFFRDGVNRRKAEPPRRRPSRSACLGPTFAASQAGIVSLLRVASQGCRSHFAAGRTAKLRDHPGRVL